jgi:hypothetical protein
MDKLLFRGFDNISLMYSALDIIPSSSDRAQKQIYFRCALHQQSVYALSLWMCGLIRMDMGWMAEHWVRRWVWPVLRG